MTAGGENDVGPCDSPRRLESRRSASSSPIPDGFLSWAKLVRRERKFMPVMSLTPSKSWCFMALMCAGAVACGIFLSTALGGANSVATRSMTETGTGSSNDVVISGDSYLEASASERTLEVEHDGALYHVADDGGPGAQWVPPEERPLPFDAFPKLNGNYDSNNRNVYDVGNGKKAAGSEQTTLLFMHIWKCAGSSLRHMLRDYAALEGKRIAIAVRCTDVIADEGSKLCLDDHELVNPSIQGPYIRQHQVLGGHFTWGFQRYVRQPYVMFTALRNPLELFVSGQQYIHRRKTKTLYKAVRYVGNYMNELMERIERPSHERGKLSAGDNGEQSVAASETPKMIGFIFRLVEPEVLETSTLEEAVQQAMRNLDTFWLVGVVEQYDGFMKVLRKLVDPEDRWHDMWSSYEVGHYNVSPNGAGKVLGGLDPDLVERFNATLRHQWQVYEHAVNLFGFRCRELLETGDSAQGHELCRVKPAASSYSLTEVEHEMMNQQRFPGVVTFNASEIVRAKRLWAHFCEEHPNERVKPGAVLDLFARQGYDLSDEERTRELWKRLEISHLFPRAVPEMAEPL